MKIKLILALAILLMFSIMPAHALDYVDVAAGETVVTNNSEVVSSDFTYLYMDGSTIAMHKAYVTSDGYSLGAARHNSRGNLAFVYCLEHWVDGYTWNSRLVATEASTSDPVWKNLSEEQRRGVCLALLYGYPNSSYGASEADAFAATQAIIWEFQTGVRNSTESNVRRSVTYSYRTPSGGKSSTSVAADKFYKIISVHSGAVTAYNGIISNIYAKPDFGTDSITLKYDNSSCTYTATLVDKNKVLSLFDVTCSGATVSVSGNTITLSSKTDVTGTLTLTRKSVKREGQAMLILTASPFGQSMIMGSKDVLTVFNYNFVCEPARLITVTKTGEVLSGFSLINGVYVPIYAEEMLPGCTAEVYLSDGTLVDTVKTASDGPVSTRLLRPETYVVTEASPPKGYVKDTSKITVTLGSSNVAVSFKNERQKCSLTFKKSLGETATPNDYSKVTFGVYNSTDILDLKADSLLEIITPDENGNCVMTVDLPFGYDYYVKEISTAEGYLIDENAYPFSFSGTEDVIEIDLGILTNEKEPEVVEPTPEPKEEPEEEVIADTGDTFKGFRILVLSVSLVFIDFIVFKFYNLFV